MKFPIAFSPPDWRTPGHSASPHIPALHQHHGPFVALALYVPDSCTGEPRTGPSSPYGSHQCWLVGKLISLVLLAALLQARMSFAFFVAGAHDGFVFSLTSRTHSPFLPSCIPAGWPPACTSPDSELWTFWISWGSCEPFLHPPFLRSGWQHSAPVYQQFSIDPMLTLVV